MQRVAAIVAGIALVAATGPLSTLHVHAYTNHDHPEHRHGLAAHEHHESAPRAHDAAEWEACEPGQHQVSLTFVCTAGQQIHAADAEPTSLAVLASDSGLPQRIARTDIRVHGPPGTTPASPRAPPSTDPA